MGIKQWLRANHIRSTEARPTHSSNSATKSPCLNMHQYKNKDCDREKKLNEYNILMNTLNNDSSDQKLAYTVTQSLCPNLHTS